MKSLTEQASATALRVITSLRGAVVHWVYSSGCMVDDRVIIANEFALQLKVGHWILLRVRRMETTLGNDYYQFIATDESTIPGIAMESGIMLHPFVQVRLCWPNEVVTRAYFNQAEEQSFESGLVYEKTLVLATSLGRVFKFEPEETIAERIKLHLPPLPRE